MTAAWAAATEPTRSPQRQPHCSHRHTPARASAGQSYLRCDSTLVYLVDLTVSPLNTYAPAWPRLAHDRGMPSHSLPWWSAPTACACLLIVGCPNRLKAAGNQSTSGVGQQQAYRRVRRGWLTIASRIAQGLQALASRWPWRWRRCSMMGAGLVDGGGE